MTIIKTLKLLKATVAEKNNGTKQKNWTGPRIFDACFCVIFRCCGQGLISGRETGSWVLPPTKLEIFLIFLSFLKFSLKLFSDS